MANDKINKVLLVLSALVIVLLVILLSRYKELLSNREAEITRLSISQDVEHEKYLEVAEKYKTADNLLLSSLSARKSITYITNVTNNNNEKNKIANLDSGSTDSLFTANLNSAKTRYSKLLD